MKRLEATFRIVTPMFLGGQDKNAVDIRSPSVKGALRFWWRALNWGRVLLENNGNEVLALRALHEHEARLFGLAAGDKKGGQGVFLLTCRPAKGSSYSLADGARLSTTHPPLQAHIYLLNMALGEMGNRQNPNKYSRSALCPGQDFVVDLIFRPQTSESDVLGIAKAIQLMGSLGALGSRARHGWGSIALQKLLIDGKPDGAIKAHGSLQELQQYLAGLLSAMPDGLPPFSALSKQARIVFDKNGMGKEWLAVLGAVGRELVYYRSNGRSNDRSPGMRRVLDNAQMDPTKPGEMPCWDDHELLYRFANGNQTGSPQRVMFGLPHPVRLSNAGDITINYADKRRASPLMLHLHEFPDGNVVAVHCLMTARFLPTDSARITMSSGRRSQNVAPPADWSVLNNYLDRVKAHGIEVSING